MEGPLQVSSDENSEHELYEHQPEKSNHEKQPEIPPPKRRQKVALKKLCTTRWDDHFQALDALACSFVEVIYCLEYFSTEDHKPDVRSRAQSLYTYFNKFESVTILCLEFEKLRIMRKCSKALQNQGTELSEASELLGTVLHDIQAIDLDATISKAEELAKLAGTQTKVSKKYADAGDKRARRQPRHLEDFALSPAHQREQERPENAADQQRKATETFKSKVLEKDIRLTKEEIERRFECFQTLNKMFSCLSPRQLINMTTAEIEDSALSISQKFSSDFESADALASEIATCKTMYGSEIKKIANSQEFLKFLLSESSMVGVAFNNLILALVLYLTLPVTVASAERSFSKLKLIKTYLRSTMGQERLSGLALMSIERERTKNINIDSVISRFLNEKKRRKF